MSDNTSNTQPGALPSAAEGFAFLDGAWRVHHRRLTTPLSGSDAWAESEGRATFITLLDGLVSVEELRHADGRTIGGALRAFDRAKRVWSDQWVGAYNGLVQPPMFGRFEGDVGTFVAEEEFEGRPILSRGVWRRVSAGEVIWEQAFSVDQGSTWELNWHMRFERIKS
jgi:hypothetical protein